VAGRRGQKRRNGGGEGRGGGEGGGRGGKEDRAVWYPLVRHIRDQPTGTLPMLAAVILRFFSKVPLFLAHVTSPLFYFRRLLQIKKQSLSIFLQFDRLI